MGIKILFEKLLKKILWFCFLVKRHCYNIILKIYSIYKYSHLQSPEKYLFLMFCAI